MELAQASFPINTKIPTVGSPLVDINNANLTLGEIVTKFLPYIFAIGGIILLLNLIYGGIGLMLSRGDPKAIESAKGRITTSLIGFIIIFVAYWIVQVAGSILGIGAIKNIFR